MPKGSTNLASYTGSPADLLSDDFKQSQYGRIILPFTILRRLECVLDPKKDQFLDQIKKQQSMSLEDSARDMIFLKAAEPPRVWHIL